MPKTSKACLICGESLKYYETEQQLMCEFCHNTFSSNASCIHGHYICDECHSKKGIEVILAKCKSSDSKNPIIMMQQLMEDPFIYMHGPEHHVMVGAVLLTASYNSLADTLFDSPSDNASPLQLQVLPPLESALSELSTRASRVPGGICGFWGCCGAAVSSGIFLSIMTQTTPLSAESWGLCNLLTSQVLQAISHTGGPRCCKRNGFTAVKETADFVKSHLGIILELPEQISCTFFSQNRECLGKNCPYFSPSLETVHTR